MFHKMQVMQHLHKQVKTVWKPSIYSSANYWIIVVIVRHGWHANDNSHRLGDYNKQRAKCKSESAAIHCAAHLKSLKIGTFFLNIFRIQIWKKIWKITGKIFLKVFENNLKNIRKTIIEKTHLDHWLLQWNRQYDVDKGSEDKSRRRCTIAQVKVISHV